MKFSVAFLVLVLVCLLTPTEAQRARNCRVGILRLTVNVNQMYALICRCGTKSRFRARRINRIPPYVHDTTAQVQLTLKCLREKLRFLAHRCQHSARAFEHAAAPIMTRCVNQIRPRVDTGAAYKFRRGSCRNEFRSITTRAVRTGKDRLETFMVCTCPQANDYSVNPGSVQFITAGTAGQADKEFQQVAQCVKKETRNLGGDCGSNTERFDLRAGQALTVCCKRARVGLAQLKLTCQGIVPDDVTKITISE